MSQISSVRLDTHVTPNQGATVASAAIERGRSQIRAAAAEARQALLTLASRRLALPSIGSRCQKASSPAATTCRSPSRTATSSATSRSRSR